MFPNPGSYKNIESVKVGDSVVSMNTETGKRVDAIVTAVIQRKDPIITINGVLKAAPDEVVYLANGETEMTGDLKTGDLFMNKNGNVVAVNTIAYSGEAVNTYDLMLAHANNFFANGYLVRTPPIR